MDSANIQRTTRFQQWGKETLHWAEKGKVFTGEVAVRLSYRNGELMTACVIESNYQIRASVVKFEDR